MTGPAEDEDHYLLRAVQPYSLTVRACIWLFSIGRVNLP